MNDSNTPEEKPEEIQETAESPSAEELPELDATELMLHGNLAAQIRYSMIKGLAEALDEKAQLLIEAESNFEPQEDETFAEIALPEIEAMAQALTDEWIDFSKIRYWESCQTAEVEWEEYKMKMVKLFNICLTRSLWKMPKKEIVCLPTLSRPVTGWKKSTFCTRKREWAGCPPMVVQRMDSTLTKPAGFVLKN